MIENVTILLTGLLISKTTNLYEMKDSIAILAYCKVYGSEKEWIKYSNPIIIIDLQGKLLIVDRDFIEKEWFTNLFDFRLNFMIQF